MKIDLSKFKKLYRFDGLEVGETFYYEGEVYMKIVDTVCGTGGYNRNVVNLEYGTLETFENEEEVELLQLKVVVDN